MSDRVEVFCRYKILKQITQEETESLNNDHVAKDYFQQSIPGQYKSQQRESLINIFLLVCMTGVSLGILLEVISAVNQNHQFTKKSYTQKTTYKVYGGLRSPWTLKHVHRVLERVGYVKSANESQWILLWISTSKFNKYELRNLNADQLVNYVPGSTFITDKVTLATSGSEYIPKAFRLPAGQKQFLLYAQKNKNAMFVMKSNGHRKVHLKNVTEVHDAQGKNFVQEYIQNPFLIDGYKFDIGVYVAITSVNPLRVYRYNGDVLIRFCPEQYYPFDPMNVNKYVVADDYLPIWMLPSMEYPYNVLGNTKKESFNIYARSKGKDPTHMWEEIHKAIAETFHKNEPRMIEALKEYKSKRNFFRLLRLDFIVDINMKVYLLEANFSPNLNSFKLRQNQLLYEQVLYNLFSLTGVTRRANVREVSTFNESDIEATKEMLGAMRNLAVFGAKCHKDCKNNCKALDMCKLCGPCLTENMKKVLWDAHTEHLHKGDYRRVIPAPMVPIMVKFDPAIPVIIREELSTNTTSVDKKYNYLSPMNKLQHLWFQGKCNQDLTWCI